MAVTYQQRFLGLNTDMSPNILPSGTADIALNVLVDRGRLQKRSGFSEFESDIDQSANSILFMDVAHYANGEIYVIVKMDTGLFYHRKVYPTDAGFFSSISLAALGYTSNRHSTSDRGWSYMWGDRWYYFDSVGGTKFYLPTPSVYRAGLPQPDTAPSLTSASGGEKEGVYHVVYTYANKATNEESVISAPPAVPLGTRLSEGNGGISIDNWASYINAAAGTNDQAGQYEWDQVKFYTTMGNTEYLPYGAGAACRSFIGYLDAEKDADHGGGGTAGLNKADHVLQSKPRFTQAGGEPPASQVGCFTGVRGVYGRVHSSGTLQPGQVHYSIPGKPTMVPRPYTYTGGGDSSSPEPRPWRGIIYTGMTGEIIAMGFGGGKIAAYTSVATFTLEPSETGRLFPVLQDNSHGAASDSAVAGSPQGVHSVGHRCWTVIGSSGWINLSEDRYQTTLEDVPLARQDQTVLGYFGNQQQVWAAVVKSGSTIAQRILVYSEDSDELVVFEPACLGETEGITFMCPMTLPNAEPAMLVGTSSGRILKYPDGTDDDGTDFEAQWRGYFGQERLEYQQRLVRASVHCGSSVADNVRFGVSRLGTGSQTAEQFTHTLTKSNLLEPVFGQLDRLDGQFFQIEFYSSDSVSDQWTIYDLVLTLDRTDKA